MGSRVATVNDIRVKHRHTTVREELKKQLCIKVFRCLERLQGHTVPGRFVMNELRKLEYLPT